MTTQNRLHLSLLWFTLLACVFSTLVAVPLALVAPTIRDLALAAILTTILCSILLWWLFIIRPQRVTIVRGGLAGILSVVLPLFLMWIMWGIASGELFLQGGLRSLLILGLVTMVGVSISPVGWVLITIGGSIGGLVAFFTQRWVSKTTTEEESSFPSE